MMKSLLVANRGEIAVRILRTARGMGLRTIAVYSDADRNAMHVAMADEAYRLGSAPAADSYLSMEKMIAAAQASGADAIHPGYGFLSENAEFAEAVIAANLVFVGPPAKAIRAMGLKDAAKTLMQAAGVPTVPGYHGSEQDAAVLAKKASSIGYPILIKPRAGGGGKGMRRVERAQDFKGALDGAKREAEASFGDPHVLIERFIEKPRHIEVQIFADTQGHVIHLGERDCSLQRRHQKVIEEAPAPGLTPQLRDEIGAIAVRAAKAIEYVGAGTVEFIVDATHELSPDAFYFIEMNTRLQVEHPVTEAITGQDLVEWQLRVAAGESLPLKQSEVAISGHAFEARIYAEDTAKGFLPAPGTLHHVRMPLDLARIDTGVRQGDTISSHYDPMIAKIVVQGETRDVALQKLRGALKATEIVGTATNTQFLLALAQHPQFQHGGADTGLIERDLPMLTTAPPLPPDAVAIAALAVLEIGKSRDSRDPWCTLSGWRHWSTSRQFVHLDYQGKTFDVCVAGNGRNQFSVTDEKGTASITLVEHDACGVLRVQSNGRIISTRAVIHGGQLTILYDGIAHVFGLPDRLAADEPDDAVSDRITSPMPGLIKAVHRKKGAAVAKGDALIVIEAMKMEYTMLAPRDGKIADVNVATGENVKSGALLLTLEQQSGG